MSSVNYGGILTIDGPGTVVNIDQQSPNNGTGLLVGFGADAYATISNGATVFVGEGNGPLGGSGFTVGSNFIPELGASATGYSNLSVTGAGSMLHVQGSAIGGWVGSASAFVDFYEILLAAPMTNPGGNGSLNIGNGGTVWLDETGGGSSVLIVADTANSSGQVSVWGTGSLLDAGQLFGLGVDTSETTGGIGNLWVADGGHVITERLVIGATSSADIHSNGVLTAGEIISSEANLKISGGTLNLTNSDLIFGAGQFLGQHYQLDDDVTINVSQTVYVDLDGVLELAGGTLGTAELINNGEVIVTTPVGVNGIDQLTNNGRISGSGRVGATLFNSTSGEVRANTGDALRFTGPGNVNEGEINLTGGSVEFSQELVNGPAGFIAGRGVIEAAAGLTNLGIMAFSGATDFLGDVENLGQIIGSAGGVLTFFDDVIHNGTEIRVRPNAAAVFFGDYAGAGALTGGGDFFFEGDLRPGNSPGLLSIDGNATFGVDTHTLMELGGLLRGVDGYDAIDVSGSLTLEGTLTVALYDLGGGLFNPALGNSFQLFDAGNLIGAFAAIILPGLDLGLAWDSSALESSGLLSVVAAAAVPLPGAVWLLLSAIAGMVAVRRRQPQAA